MGQRHTLLRNLGRSLINLTHLEINRAIVLDHMHVSSTGLASITGLPKVKYTERNEAMLSG